MKLKKVMKILPGYERIRVWADNENTPIYDGCVADLPKKFCNLKLTQGSDDSYFEVRYGCDDIGDHVAVFVEESVQ